MIPDITDGKILRVISADSRLSYRKIAKKIGVSTLTVLTRMKRMEENGVIKGYSALIDHKKLGLGLTALIDIKVTKGRVLVSQKLLAVLENVYGVWGVTGDTDLIILAKFADTDMLSKFVKKVMLNPNIASVNTHVVLETVKEDII